MQHAVRNRATIRVADSTDLSGRVTADEVNLDGFHSPICKVRLIARTWLALVTVSSGLYLGLPVCGLAQNNQGRNNQGQNDQGVQPGVPNGTYAFQDAGYVLDPSGSGNLVPLGAAGRLTFFANGTTSGLVSFSIGGTVFRRVTLKGSFKVNADGSVSETETQFSGPGLTLHFDDYPTPDGNTITFVATDPGSIVSGFDTRGR